MSSRIDHPPAPAPILSILVPAYNEATTIAEVLNRISAYLDREDGPSGKLSYEVVVCDDGSRDATAAVLREAAAGDRRIRLVFHQQNRGKGAAIRSALAAAHGQVVLIQDADLEYDVRDYAALIAPILAGRTRVVYGSRFLRRAWPRHMAPSNWLANKILASTANVLYGLHLTDEATCYKAFRRELLVGLQLRCRGFDFCPEVTARLGLCGEPIIEVPIRYAARSHLDGKKIRWSDGVQALWVLVSHYLRAHLQKIL